MQVQIPKNVYFLVLQPPHATRCYCLGLPIEISVGDGPGWGDRWGLGRGVVNLFHPGCLTTSPSSISFPCSIWHPFACPDTDRNTVQHVLGVETPGAPSITCYGPVPLFKVTDHRWSNSFTIAWAPLSPYAPTSVCWASSLSLRRKIPYYNPTRVTILSQNANSQELVQIPGHSSILFINGLHKP